MIDMTSSGPGIAKRSEAAADASAGGDALPTPARTEEIASVVDLFCGAGGLSHGFVLEGVPVACGIDIDEECRFPFERNNRAPFVCRDVATLRGTDLRSVFAPGKYRILVGCAPCQPFSLYTQGRAGRGIEDPKWSLLREFGRLIDETKPDIVSMENVQRLRQFRDGKVLAAFVRRLRKAGYFVTERDVYCPDYGMAQKRTRLVLLASRFGPIDLEPPTHGEDRYRTVREAIGHLRPLHAGEADPTDPLHAAAGLSEINLRRVRASSPGGTWRDWPEDLRLACHKRESGRHYGSVYGRMTWDEPSPTITTQFHGVGNGRFGHPDQNRALSLREGAVLQSFPVDYVFVADDSKPNFSTLGRLIGNAVPVELGRVIARSVMSHLEGIRSGSTKARLPAGRKRSERRVEIHS